MKRLCTICARGGSKGVKGKNLRLLAGKPLIVHSLEQARRSGLFAVIGVSSDSDDILRTAGEWGADYLVKRPAVMASDTAGKLPAIRHCAETIEKRCKTAFDTFVDLDCTSPLRTIEDIRDAIALLEAGDAGNVVTGMPSRRSPYFNLVEVDERGGVHLSKPPKTPIARRQDAPPCYDMNASIYVWRRAALFSDSDTVLGDDARLFIMPEERSIDIDSELDFRFVEFLLSQG